MICLPPLRPSILGILAGTMFLACGPCLVAADESGQIFYPADKLEREQGKAGQNPDKVLPAPAAPAEQKPVAPVILQDGLVRVVLGGRNGMIREVRDVSSATVLVRNVEDFYELQTQEKTDRTASEDRDQVIDRKESDGRAAFRCTNPDLPGITLVKEYALKDGLLSKRVQVLSSEATPRLFLAGSQFSPAGIASVQNEAYGFETTNPYFPETHEAIFWLDRWGPSGMRVMPVFVHPTAGVTAGVYTHRINGRFIYARENDSWSLENGNALKSRTLAGGFVAKDRALDYEWHVRVVRGDALDFFNAYRALSGYREIMEDQTDPAWFDRVRYVTDAGTSDLLGPWQPGQELPPAPAPGTNLLLGSDPANTMVFTLFGWGNLGGYPLDGRWLTYEPKASPMDADGVRRALQRSTPDPRERTALYDWNCSFDPKTPPYPEHPEWIARDRDGNPQVSFFHGAAAFWPDDAKPNYLNPDYRAFVLGRLGRFPEVYGVSSLYLDAEAGDRHADWKTHTWFQPYERQDFKRAMRRAVAPELPLLKNTPNAPYVSGAYWEGHGMRAEGMEARWRSLGGKMLSEKIWQWGHRWTALMKWGYSAPNEPYYSNYLVGLGYKPHAPDDPLRKSAYLQAAFEMRHLQLLPTKFSPCFWRNDPTEAEIYLLRQGSTVYASCIGHAKGPGTVTLHIDSAGLPFKKGTRLYLWKIDLDRADQVPDDLEAARLAAVKAGKNPLDDPALVARWTGRAITHPGFLGETTLGDSKLEIPVELAPARLTMVAITDVPAVVLAEGDEASKMNVPGTADVQLALGPESSAKRATLSVDSRRGCRLALMAPKGKTIREVTLGGQALSLKSEPLGGTSCQTADVPSGKQDLVLTYKKSSN